MPETCFFMLYIWKVENRYGILYKKRKPEEIMKSYTFRKVKDGEPAAVFALILERMHWLAEKGIPQWKPGEYDKVYPLEYYQSVQNDLYVLLDNETNEVVSAGVLFENDKRWEDKDTPALYLHNFAAKVGAHGAGDAFLEHAERCAKEHGKIYMRLDSAENNEALAKYYGDRGYLPVGTCTDGGYNVILRQKKL